MLKVDPTSGYPGLAARSRRSCWVKQHRQPGRTTGKALAWVTATVEVEAGGPEQLLSDASAAIVLSGQFPALTRHPRIQNTIWLDTFLARSCQDLAAKAIFRPIRRQNLTRTPLPCRQRKLSIQEQTGPSLAGIHGQVPGIPAKPTERRFRPHRGTDAPGDRADRKNHSLPETRRRDPGTGRHRQAQAGGDGTGFRRAEIDGAGCGCPAPTPNHSLPIQNATEPLPERAVPDPFPCRPP
jgi:hypothetical protein